MATFFNIHNHTDYSNIRMLDSINRVSDLIETSARLGLSGIAITDHECLSSHKKALKAVKTVREKYPDFSLALGNEIYLVDERQKKQKYYHFILVAKDFQGYKALRELSSMAWSQGYKDTLRRVPTLKSELEDVVSRYKGHLVASTACLGGQLSSAVQKMITSQQEGDTEKEQEYRTEIVSFVKWCQSLFGEDFYIECAPSTKDPQVSVNKVLVKIGEEMSVKVIPATDSHYLSVEDRVIHKGLLQAEDKDKSKDREVDEFYEFARCMSYEECHELLCYSMTETKATEILLNTLEVQSKITDYSLDRPQRIPEINTLENYPKCSLSSYGGIPENSPIIEALLNSENIQERFWSNECLIQLRALNLVNDEYLSRLEREADTVDHIGKELNICLFSYFNTFKHYIDMFWECGSIVGPGRGSATGFLSNYLLGITQLDPIRWGLQDWRFLNKSRAELPEMLGSCKKRVLTAA